MSAERSATCLYNDGPADADALCDGVHDDAIEAFLLEQDAGGVDDGLARRPGRCWHVDSIGY